MSLRECLSLVLGSGPPGKGALGSASVLIDQLGSGMSGEDQEQALFLALESMVPGQIPGLGPASQARVLAAFELARRYAVWREVTRWRPASVHSSLGSFPELAHQALVRVPAELRCEPREWLGFVPIYPPSQRGRVGQLCVVERGVRTHVNTDPVELFARVLALRPKGFFLFHNHPSGSLEPSTADRELTSQVGQTGRTLGIRLFGHWIVSPIGERWLDFVV